MTDSQEELLRRATDKEEIADQSRLRARGIYLLPNLFTSAALFSGFYAIVSAMGGQYEQSAIAIFIAMVLDGLDGRVARMTNTQSAFGAEYDSLSDMVIRSLKILFKTSVSFKAYLAQQRLLY